MTRTRSWLRVVALVALLAALTGGFPGYRGLPLVSPRYVAVVRLDTSQSSVCVAERLREKGDAGQIAFEAGRPSRFGAGQLLRGAEGWPCAASWREPAAEHAAFTPWLISTPTPQGVTVRLYPSRPPPASV